MGRRLVVGTGIAAGVAVVAGLGIGFAAGEPVEEDDITPARRLPGDFCARLGDVSALLPKATEPPRFAQTGKADVHCRVSVDEATQDAYTGATLDVWVTPHPGRLAGAGQPPFEPAQVAKRAFDREPGEALADRPYPTKLKRSSRTGGQDWTVTVVVLRGDITVQVDYRAWPVTAEKAEQAALVMADRAIWESK